MSHDSTALPSELLVAPQPLIGLCGLDVNVSPAHKVVWDAFSSNRKADRAAIQFKLLPTNYDFPVAKPRRSSYEWYHPKGILKRNWMLKHLHVLPAVVVLFQEIEWNDPFWTEKQLQCASQVQTLKNALQERNTRICVVLMQESPPQPPGEDMLASERAASLTAACGINSKMLFILPRTDHLMGYVLRLEPAFLDMAQSYYTLMAKRIRTHRDQLTAAHTYLKIRHQFKLGFVAEIRQDFSTALKHYTQSYTTLDEVRINDANCLEVKTVAGFINYKICRLMFKLKVPRDSINHFISHVEKYKNRVGPKDVAFEHYAWLSTQHNVFAEIFCEAIKNGLPALQTQHPGIYFHKAAEYTQRRKEAFHQILGSSGQIDARNNANTPASNATSLYTEYFGIRSLKTGEPLSDQQTSAIILDNEKHFNHSSTIINLLSLAMAQFKIYKCLRFRKKLAIDMADEYFSSGDHGKALTLYSLMLPDYRQEKWSSLFSDVLLKTMRCALLSISVSDFITCSLEALSFKIKCSPNERVIVLENLWKLLQGEAPLPKSQQCPDLRTRWEEALKTVKSPAQIDLDKLTDLIETCATFEQFEVKNDDVIKLNVILRLQTDVPIKIRSLQVIVTDGSNNYKLQPSQYAKYADLMALRNVDDSNDALQPCEQPLKLEPAFYHRFLFATEAQQFLENTQLRVVRIEALVGSDNFSMSLYKSATYSNNTFRYHSRCRDLDDNITIVPICYITPTFHLVTQCSFGSTSMLVNEYHQVTTTVCNPYDVFLTGIAISISVPNNLRNKVFLAIDVASKQKLHSSIQFDIGELAMQNSNTVSFYVFSLVEATISLHQKVCYTTDVPKPKVTTAVIVNDVTTPSSSEASPEAKPASAIGALNALTAASASPAMPLLANVQLEFLDESRLRKTQETVLSVACEPEFRFQGRFYTLDRKPLTKIYQGENFLLRAALSIQTGIELEVLETYFICDHNLTQSTYSFKRKKFSNADGTGQKLEDVVMLRTDNSAPNWTSLRDYERNKANDLQHAAIFSRLRSSRKQHGQQDARAAPSIAANQAAVIASPNVTAEDGLLSCIVPSNSADEGVASQVSKPPPNTRLMYGKALDAFHATGHLRGFLKGTVHMSDAGSQQTQDSERPLFGIYCVKWRRSGSRDENESKFLVTGLPIVEPPLNVVCSIEEKMFVKMPITFKVVLRNPTAKVVHLIATLSISITDNFICSGHKQLDISIFAFGEKELVYNLYPLQVGWQSLPELSLVYNTQADPTKDESQNILLNELVQRSILKKVFVLPPLKQQVK